MISKLYASDAAAPGQFEVLLSSMFPFILIFFVFYFLLIRPQKKKQLQHRKMIQAIKVGDKVLLNSGMKGTVTAVKEEDFVVVEIAEGVKVEILKSYVLSVTPSS